MNLKAVFLSAIMVAFGAVHAGTLSQGAETARSVTAPADKRLAPSGILADPKLGGYDETYNGLHSFWSDETIGDFFENVAEGTLDQVGPLVAELCEKWRHRDVHLPVTGIIGVPPDIRLDLNRLCR
jgi:hypothetical protein